MSHPDTQSACKDYVGRTQKTTDSLPPLGANSLLATLDHPDRLGNGDPVPALFHWLYFNQPVPTHLLNADGHEQLGEFIPPVPYPRRMWAGSTIEFHNDLLIGQTATRESTIKSVEFKSGKSGRLCFVDIEHRYHQNNTLCLSDIHTIVYKETIFQDSVAQRVATTGDERINSESKKQGIELANTVALNSIILFRYSALTFNSHRIHYDQSYCRDVESYPDLVVHGPLMATLLVRHIQASRPEQSLSTFSFRILAPVFANESFRLDAQTQGNAVSASITMPDGTQAMSADATWKTGGNTG